MISSWWHFTKTYARVGGVLSHASDSGHVRLSRRYYVSRFTRSYLQAVIGLLVVLDPLVQAAMDFIHVVTVVIGFQAMLRLQVVENI